MSRKNHIERHYTKWGYIFVIPFVVVFLIFSFWPMASTIYYAFCYLKHAGNTNPEFLPLIGKPWYQNFKDVFIVYGITLLITLSLTTIIDLRTIGGVHSNFYILLALFIPWMADTGAYFTGITFGKTMLCPDLSPNKTLEGAFGGIIFCVLTNLLVSFIFKIFFLPQNIEVNYLYVVVLALLGSLISIVGDLFFSMVKRCYRVKDFGNVMPGHGGVLDRFDSVILVAPFVYFMLKNFDILLKI